MDVTARISLSPDKMSQWKVSLLIRSTNYLDHRNHISVVMDF